MQIDRLKRFCTSDSGTLVPVEFKDLPFVPVRSFTVDIACTNANGNMVSRGGHAHYKTKQYFICIKGRVKITLMDGKKAPEVISIAAGNAVFIDKMIWDEYTFISSVCMCLVFCSTLYDPEDYINDFEEFKKLAAK